MRMAAWWFWRGLRIEDWGLWYCKPLQLVAKELVVVGLSKIGDPSEAIIYVERDRGGIWRDIRPLSCSPPIISVFLCFCISVFMYLSPNWIVWSGIALKSKKSRLWELAASWHRTWQAAWHLTSPLTSPHFHLGMILRVVCRTRNIPCTDTIATNV